MWTWIISSVVLVVFFASAAAFFHVSNAHGDGGGLAGVAGFFCLAVAWAAALPLLYKGAAALAG
ncbi:MAG: hypothetical protein HQL35_15485 [Alphaproteobacteria bacterium]|nr:hypothetical protein [Alphaproteobacteria bacterium]